MTRVLIADDDPAVRRLLAHQLKAVGVAEVVEAADGRQALDLLDQGELNLILLDWHMPKIDGLELLSVVRDRGCRVPVVMVTGEARKDLVLKAFKAGATDYVVKPFGEDVLRKKLGKFCPIAKPKGIAAIPLARDVTNTDTVVIRSDATVEEAIDGLLRSGASGLPVVDAKENLVGMITEFQLTKAVHRADIRRGTVGDLMTREVIVTNETTALPVVVAQMDKHQLALIPVTRNGKVVGTIARRDLLRFARGRSG